VFTAVEGLVSKTHNICRTTTEEYYHATGSTTYQIKQLQKKNN
jgi:hypothetical protein